MNGGFPMPVRSKYPSGVFRLLMEIQLSLSDIPMVKPTQDRQGEDASCALDVAGNRRVPVQR